MSFSKFDFTEPTDYVSQVDRLRYFNASVLYDKVIEDNIKRLISELSDKDRAAFHDQGQKNDDEIRAFFRVVNHFDDAQEKEKSCLFKRLMAGKDPLPIAPPLSWSYPWYEVIEDDGPWPISISRLTETVDVLIRQGIDFNTAQRFTGIDIHQCLWTVLERRSATCCIVSFRKWVNFGYVWSLERHAVEAYTSRSHITAINNSRFIGKVKTIDDLRLVELGRVEKKLNCLMWARDGVEAQTFIDKQRAISILSELSANAQVRAGLELAFERKHAGLSVTPSRDEVLVLAERGVSKILKDGYFVREEDGMLMAYEWSLSAVSKGDLKSVFKPATEKVCG
ncbi:hypothetical protein [Rhodoferax antarcticus]|nr:hypothetical protein [Rhodoferax antarcticus]